MCYHVRPAGDWKGAGGHGAVIPRCQEVLRNALAYPTAHPDLPKPRQGHQAHVRTHEPQADTRREHESGRPGLFLGSDAVENGISKNVKSGTLRKSVLWTNLGYASSCAGPTNA